MYEIQTCCGSEAEAKKIGEFLLEKKKAGCVNIFPVKSAYWWKGKIEEAEEWVLSLKTDKLEEVIGEVKKKEVRA